MKIAIFFFETPFSPQNTEVWCAAWRHRAIVAGDFLIA
jgi:hypothetical protein